MTTTTKPSSIDKLSVTTGERYSARPQQQAKWVRDYCAMRPESVAWAQDVVQKYRSKNPVRTQDDFWVSPQEVMKQYPSLHADELILVIFLRPTLVR